MLEVYLTNNLDLIPKYFMTEAQTAIFQQSNKTYKEEVATDFYAVENTYIVYGKVTDTWPENKKE